MTTGLKTASDGLVPFKPVWWLPDGHTQTLWRRLASRSWQVAHQRERLELADGDFLDLDWCGPDVTDDASRPVLIIIHGLCGCSGSPYVRSLQLLLQAHGQRSVAVNLRGCSGEVNRLAKAYHSGCSEDLDAVFSHLAAAHPSSRFAFVGFSLGGNMLLKWLAETGPHPQVAAGVAVSTPFSLARCAEAMNRGLSRFYGRHFLRRLVSDLEAKKRHFREQGQDYAEQLAILESFGDLSGLQSLWEFDDRVTAPLHGFASAKDYYNRCSSSNFVGRIGTPTLIIQSANDPIIPVSTVPDRSSLPETVDLQLMSGGGHVGFTCAGNGQWLENRIMTFIIQSQNPTPKPIKAQPMSQVSQ